MNIVVLGISTGGPKTLRQIFRNLPRLQACVLLVQHMPSFINESVVRTLQAGTEMDVALARTGDTLEAGRVLVAPSEFHLSVVHNRRIHLSDGPKVNYVKPAVDVTLRSLKRMSSDSLTAMILTGLGGDGAAGVRHVKELNGTVFAQDEQTCVIFGMPKAAIETGCVDHVLPPAALRGVLIERFAPAEAHASASG
jgi:two-component system chemotaxis response regulator CheB